MANDRTFQVRIRSGHRTDLEVMSYSRTIDLNDEMYIKTPTGRGVSLSVGDIAKLIEKYIFKGFVSEAEKRSGLLCNNCKNRGPNSSSCLDCVRRAPDYIDRFEPKK